MAYDYKTLLDSIGTLKERFEAEFSCIEADSNIKILHTSKGKDDYDIIMAGKLSFDDFYKFVNQ